MSKVHEIKFFNKNGELLVALYDKPSPFLPEFWITDIKGEELNFETLPENIKLKRKYKVEKFGIEPFEFNKKGLLFGISDLFNRLTRELNQGNQTNIIINRGNYNEKIEGNYYEQKGDNNTI